jgi:hypothetical protein
MLLTKDTMKTDKNFRLSKTTKRMLALMKGTAQERNAFKRMMVEAEYSEARAKLAKLKDKE